jgi:hypothetical protein
MPSLLYAFAYWAIVFTFAAVVTVHVSFRLMYGSSRLVLDFKNGLGVVYDHTVGEFAQKCYNRYL